MGDKGEIFEVVVSGVGGKFPMAENIEDLRINLNNKVNMVTENECRWKKGELAVGFGLPIILTKPLFYFIFFFFIEFKKKKPPEIISNIEKYIILF